MSEFIKNVFYIIGMLVLSLCLWTLLFGDIGRSIMWNGTRPIMERHWLSYTLDDGRLLEQALDAEFDMLVDLSTE